MGRSRPGPAGPARPALAPARGNGTKAWPQDPRGTVGPARPALAPAKGNGAEARPARPARGGCLSGFASGTSPDRSGGRK